MAEETDARLARMRRALVKLRREGREREFAAVAEAYAGLKREQMERVEEEQRAAARARAAVRRAERPVEGVSGRWRLPRGFASPLAAQRAREASSGRVVPVGRPALNPWGRGWSPAQEQIWRP
jgi:hypothetical protein